MVGDLMRLGVNPQTCSYFSVISKSAVVKIGAEGFACAGVRLGGGGTPPNSTDDCGYPEDERERVVGFCNFCGSGGHDDMLVGELWRGRSIFAGAMLEPDAMKLTPLPSV